MTIGGMFTTEATAMGAAAIRRMITAKSPTDRAATVGEMLAAHFHLYFVSHFMSPCAEVSESFYQLFDLLGNLFHSVNLPKKM
jgi:hypothetical protein